MKVELRRLKRDDFPRFAEMTTSAYRVNYGDVDVSMAEHILASHSKGVDPIGYTTLRKEVFSICVERKAVGFTTLTWKRGGSVKTGPTILFPESRGQGIGPLVQLELQKYVSAKGGRKTYGTVSDANERALKYMLKAGYEVEAKLKDHYSTGKNEVVLGRLLTAPPRSPLAAGFSLQTELNGRNKDARIAMADSTKIQSHAIDITALFDQFLAPADNVLISNLALAVSRNLIDFANKPKRVAFIFSDQSLIGAVIFVPKRGGAIKVNVLGILGTDTFLATLSMALPAFAEAGFRKTSLFLPVHISGLSKNLLAHGWSCEGRLREPYKAGIDVNVISKFLD